MLSDLTAALGGDGRTDFRGGAALRIRVRLQPIAGDGARVMPSTYDIDGKAGYITEQRRLGGVEVPCVLIDSQASQSNRLEATLADSMSAGAIRIPDITVDLAEFGVSSALTLPHRLFDAMCEDALLDGARFGSTPQYDALAGVIHRGVAGPLVERFPVGLLLGGRRGSPTRRGPRGSLARLQARSSPTTRSSASGRRAVSTRATSRRACGWSTATAIRRASRLHLRIPGAASVPRSSVTAMSRPRSLTTAASPCATPSSRRWSP